MKKDKFETYFWTIFDRDLHNSLSPWQVDRIKTMVKKAINKGRKINKNKLNENN